MIPVRLFLKNFMCYRDNVPPLNFENFRIACLCGDNGHGKSALLDAMTWALWGRSRAKTNDELVHLGQNEMSVEFDFDVPPYRYRLIRTYRTRSALKRPGQTNLEMLIASNGQHKPLTTGVKETENKIIDLLKLDYDTFVNSAFLRQGKADEFTRKTPSERKEILANILNLSIYDRLADRAKENSSLKSQELLRIKAFIENNNKEMEKKAAYLERKEALEQSLQQLNLEMDKEKTELEKARDEKQKLEVKETQAQQIEENLLLLKREEKASYSRVDRHRQRIEQFLRLIGRKSDIEKSYGRYLLVMEEEKALSEKFSTLAQLREKKGNLERIIEKDEGELKREYSLQLRTVQELEGKVARKQDLQKKEEELKKRADQINRKAEVLEGKKQAHADLKDSIAGNQAEQKRLANSLQDGNEKKSLIKDGVEDCPLCGQRLGEDGISRIKEHYQEEIQSAEKSLRETGDKLRVELDRQKVLLNEITEMEKKLDTDKRLYEREEGLRQKALQETEEAQLKLPQEKAALEALIHKLESGDYASEQKSAVAQIEEKIKELGYSEEHHNALKAELVKLQDCQKEKILLDAAEKELEGEKAEEEQAKRELQEKSKQIELEDAKLEQLKQELFSLPEIRSIVDDLVKKMENREKEKGNLLQQLGGLEENLKGCLDKEKENQHLEIEKAGCEHEISLFERLAQAFGKKGIQAHIIDSALPEINNEANDLLAEISNGRMSLQLEMRPESSTGKITESLEIKIADELGTRSYEMFSGGEAFRIDFALRIALSRFLARRAGAPLSFLIIDEGFGSQDEAGKHKLVDALNRIQNNFDKILVITHLPELKEAFPYRIIVNKTEEGSTISLEEG